MKPLDNVLKDGKELADDAADAATPPRRNVHRYTPAPANISGIPGLRRARPKTPVQGGGGLRRRWVDQDGNIYEWDSQHGTLERYDRRGRHQGEYDPTTGNQTKPPDASRRVEP
jgi:hypothetical protein